MKLLGETPGAVVFEKGAVLHSYYVEHGDDGHRGPALRYRVRDRRGNAGTLLLARRPFADHRERARFEGAAGLRLAFKHPAAIDVQAMGEYADRPYLVTEPHGDRTFADLLEREAPLEPGRLVSMLAPVAAALDAAHAQNLVHQGLSSESLVLDTGDWLLLDSFALFELSDEQARSMQHHDLRYRPPEQLQGRRVDASGDVYSLGAIVVHALTGQPPFTRDGLAVGFSHMSDAPPAVSERVPMLGSRVDAVLARAMSKDPVERQESASALIAEVAEALRLAGALAVAPLDAPRAGTRLRAPHFPRVAAVVVAAVVAAVCGAGLAAAVQPFGGDGGAGAPAVADAATWKALDAERSDLRARLAAAETAQEQAGLAAQLAAAYGDAARAAPVGTQARGLREARDAYAELATAAEAGSETNFAVASTAVVQTELRLQTRR